MNSLTKSELKEFLDYKVNQFNNPTFIELDPVSIPHQVSHKEDIEIAAFLTSTPMFEPTYKKKKPSVTDMPVMRSKLRPTF
jgi:hypothetical protein